MVAAAPRAAPATVRGSGGWLARRPRPRGALPEPDDEAAPAEQVGRVEPGADCDEQEYGVLEGEDQGTDRDQRVIHPGGRSPLARRRSPRRGQGRASPGPGG